MLTEMGDGSEPISFRSKDIDAFIDYYNDNIHSDKIKTLKTALDELDKAFEENVKIKQTSIPMVCYGMYKVVDSKKDSAKYVAWLKKFVETYDTNEEYLKYCNGGGTASAEMVKGRLKYFEDAVKKMQSIVYYQPSKTIKYFCLVDVALLYVCYCHYLSITLNIL